MRARQLAGDEVVADRIVKNYGKLSALGEISFNIASQSIVGIIGPSGCGKSTLLQIVAGTLEPTSGTVRIRGLAPSALRGTGDVGLVFQDETLLPWRTVEGNVRLPNDLIEKKYRHPPQYIDEVIQVVGLRDFKNAFPRQLSGGMRRRVSVARALVTQPRLLLLDEPFGALDEPLRRRLMLELEKIWLAKATSALLVTHSVSEAVFLADTILILSSRPGRITKTISIVEPRPRGEAFLSSARFHEICDEAIRDLPAPD